MKEISILSGKGGTGKTSIAAALASVSEEAVFCDTDVDAADLHLILDPDIKEYHQFPGGLIASIDPESCNACGICKEFCRFDAIHINQEGGYYINPHQCEGCRLCERICPEKAISSRQSMDNSWYVSDTRLGTLVHAKMGPGEENSGRLVSQVRKRARELAKASGARYVINDGPPGIGCAAIASVTGTQAVLMVIEPTLSGLHDVKRLSELVESFKIPAYAIINKYDLHIEVSSEIESWLLDRKIMLLAKIPFNEAIVEAMIQGKSFVEYDPDSEISGIMRNIWKSLSNKEI